MKESMINIYKLLDELLVERDEEKRGKIIKKLNKIIKKNLNDLLENSEERIDIEILQHPLTEDNYGYMIPRFMVIISRYFSKAVAA